ncbi:MAG: T9SS type A sorting domain-containing protein [bacterium]
MKILTKIPVKLLILMAITLFAFTAVKSQTPPSLTYPTANALCIPLETTFSWETIETAIQYRLQISTSATWTSPDVTEAVMTHPTSTFTFTLPESNTEYYWRVSASFSEDEDFSAIRKFTTQGDTPELEEPVDEETCVNKSTLFQWSSITGAGSYRMQIATSTTFSGGELVYDYESIPSTTFTSATFSALMPQNYKTYYWRVAAKYGTCYSEWTEPFSFTVKQAAPIVVYPTAAATGISTSTSLSWTEVTPASTYDIQIATNSNFSTIVQSFVNLSQTTTTITPLLYNTTYYWRMKSKLSGCESEWSAGSSFKTVYDAPSLNSPYDGRVCLDLSGYKFEWYEVPGVQAYQIQISKDEMFIDLVINQENILDLFYSNATLPEGLTDYYWRVRAKDANNTGKWSNYRIFTTTISPVQPVYPVKNSGGIPINMVFRWTNVTKGAGTYNLQISKSPAFADTLVSVTGLTSTSYTYNLQKYNTEFYWRVSAAYDQCTIGYSTPWKFRSVLAAPNLTSPVDGAEDLSFSVFFEWTRVDSAKSYTIHISESPNFTPVTFGYSGINNNHYFKSGLEPDKEYYWKVQAVNEFGAGPFSSVRSFTTITKGPTIPLLTFPLLAAEQVDLDVTLRWNPSERVDNYHLQVANNENFATPIVNIDTITVNYYNLTGLANDVMYYWHVSAINDSGETGWSIPWRFRTLLIAPDDAAVLLEPANAAIDVERNTVLKWEPVQYATYYEVLVSKTDDFSGELFVNDPMCFNPQKTVGGQEYGATYYWKVRGKNASGIAPWSETRSYTVRTLGGVNDEAISKYQIQTYPNPFGQSSLLSFNINKPENVTVKLYNIAGVHITTLMDNQLAPGDHFIRWEPTNLETGVYFYSIQIGETRMLKEITYIK